MFIGSVSTSTFVIENGAAVGPSPMRIPPVVVVSTFAPFRTPRSRYRHTMCKPRCPLRQGRCSSSPDWNPPEILYR